MHSITMALVVFACVFGGALIGMFLRAALPEHHLSADTKDVVKVAIALIATMGALVLSLLISSAKNAYDTRGGELMQLSVDIVLLDRTLAHYGPETKDARARLRRLVAIGIEQFWPSNGVPTSRVDPAGSPIEALYDTIEGLAPQTERQRTLQAQALKVTTDLGHARFLLVEQAGSSIPSPFLVVLVFWLTIIFASFGLFAPRNATVIGVLLVSALSVAGAIFLILELDRSFEGIIQVSSAPLRQALARLGE